MRFSKWTFQIRDEKINGEFKSFMRGKAIKNMYMLLIIAMIMIIHDTYMYTITCQHYQVAVILDVILLTMTAAFYKFTRKAAWTIELLSFLFYLPVTVRMIYLTSATLYFNQHEPKG